MTIKNLLYLAQLEDYEPKRIQNWLQKNPHRPIQEIKGHLIWTSKSRIIFIKASFFSLFLPYEEAIILAIKLFQPFDNLIKFLFVTVAKLKFRIFNSHCLVIGITGSWGKTTTKDRLYYLLQNKYHTVATLNNSNTLLGVVKQLLKLSSSTQIFICEMGAYQRGDIKAMCSLVHPQIGIITAIGPMHLERFGSLENIYKGKLELLESLPPNGLAILPHSLKSRFKGAATKKYFLYPNTIIKIIAQKFGLKKDNALIAIKTATITNHRQEIIKNNGLTIIDDTYNSNPIGFHHALLKLKKIKTDNRILITPGMIELGDLQYQENFKIAILAQKICNTIIIVGETNRLAFSDALKNKSVKVHFVDSLKDAQDLLPQVTTPGAALLFENDLPDNYF